MSQRQNDSSELRPLLSEQQKPFTYSQLGLQDQRTLEVLSSLSYRAGELDTYLSDIACGVSRLLSVDWSVVTIYHDGVKQVMASNRDLCTCSELYSLYGFLTQTVIETGRSLTVENALIQLDLASTKYLSYLGVPLKTARSKVIGTICCFCKYPRQFAAEELRTAELFAERAATAIDNYSLYQQQRQFNEILEAEVAKRTEELQKTQARLIERERLAAIGEFAAMIVHEIRNPVTTIRMGLNYFKRISLSDLDQERADLSLGEADRLEKLLEEILLYAKPQLLQVTQLDVNELIQEMLVLLREMPEAVDRNIQFVPIQPTVQIMGDKDKLRQVFINLVRNACEAIAPDQTVTWSILPSDAHIHIQVHNSGDPIPPDVLPKLGEPFYSTKQSGTGLGLAIVKRIVEAHGGAFSIQSDAASGTIMNVQLPVAA